MILATLILLLLCFSNDVASSSFISNPLTVINTWPFTNATNAAFDRLLTNNNPLDSVEIGCNICEIQQCDFTVGYGGSPDSEGETTLDAMIMDGNTFNVGAVAYLRRIKDAIKVARAVLHHSSHSILAGSGATTFAKMMGFNETSLTTNYSSTLFHNWKSKKSCQPNYYRNFLNSSTSCPPYLPQKSLVYYYDKNIVPSNMYNHDTIGMVAVSSSGNVAVGTSSNGANHKIAGRVGDAPIPGAGAYGDSTVGGCAATGDGDVMMRFLPTFQAVELMRSGYSATNASEAVMRRIAKMYPSFNGGIVCATSDGSSYGAASHGWTYFKYSVQTFYMKEPVVISVPPI